MKKKLGFLKSLFLGDVNNDLIFPYPTLSDDNKETMNMLLDSLGRLAKESINSVQIDEESEIPQNIVDQFKELGLFGLIIPEQYEGFGFNTTMYNLVESQLTAHDSSCSLLIGAHSSIGMKAILLFGNDEQKKKYLPKLASGEYIAAFCLTEPNAGSDAGSIKTKAVLSEDKSHYILNGSKIWITNGGIADLFTVFAKTEGKISSFIVTRDMGVSSGPKEKKLGIKGSNTTALYFENIKVPVENRIGEEGKGFKIAMSVLNQGRLGLAAGCIGAAKEALKLALEHAKKREQFNQPIINFEMIRDKLSQMASSIFIMDAMSFLSSRICDQDDIDYQLESAVCKIYCSERLWYIINEAFQIAGGIAYMKEYPYERMLRDARINMIFEGSNEVLHAFIALQGSKELGKELMNGKLEEIQKRKPQLKDVDPSLKEAREIFNEGATFLKELSLSAVMEYQYDIIKKEYIQMRISNIAIYLYGLAAGISKCESLIQDSGVDQAEHSIFLLSLFAREAQDKFQKAHIYFKDPHDDIKNKIVQNLSENQNLI